MNGIAKQKKWMNEQINLILRKLHVKFDIIRTVRGSLVEGMNRVLANRGKSEKFTIISIILISLL